MAPVAAPRSLRTSTSGSYVGTQTNCGMHLAPRSTLRSRSEGIRSGLQARAGNAALVATSIAVDAVPLQSSQRCLTTGSARCSLEVRRGDAALVAARIAYDLVQL
jgi:hypothetical protein